MLLVVHYESANSKYYVVSILTRVGDCVNNQCKYKVCYLLLYIHPILQGGIYILPLLKLNTK